MGPEHEAPQAGAGGASDAVTFAFGDRSARLYGLARTGIVPGSPPTRSGMGLLFDGSEPVAARAEGGVPDEAPAGVAAEVVEPLRRWRVRFADAFDLEVEALSLPASVGGDDDVARQGGMEGYEQLCRFHGTVAGRRVDCLGQRGHSWGAPDWSKLALTRSISAWLSPESAVTVTAVRRSNAKHHADEALAACVIEDGVPLPVAEPLVSTTYDREGRQRHAGLELWLDHEGGHARRTAGEVLCGTTLDLGRLRLDAAFFAWHMEGRAGVGRYDVLRRADA